MTRAPDPEPVSFASIADETKATHAEKSGAYGSDDDEYLNFSVVAHASGDPRYVYPIQRILEKCVRVLQLARQGRHDELDLKDIPSLGILAEQMRREDYP